MSDRHGRVPPKYVPPHRPPSYEHEARIRWRYAEMMLWYWQVSFAGR